MNFFTETLGRTKGHIGGWLKTNWLLTIQKMLVSVRQEFFIFIV